MNSVSNNLNSNITYKLFYFLVLVLFLRVDLVFENNTPTGGDMGAHIVAINTFIKDFMPNFQINGWSNDWFSGYPLYYFYFPLPAIITFFFNLIFPFGVAFKIMVVMSMILVVFSIEKLMRNTPNQISIFGATAGLFYVFTESFTIYGGNLASTLAGQFSFGYSLAFANLSIFYLIKSNNNFRFPISSTFLALCLLSHLIPFIVYSPIYAFYWLAKKTKSKSKSTLYFHFFRTRFKMVCFIIGEFRIHDKHELHSIFKIRRFDQRRYFTHGFHSYKFIGSKG